MAAAVADQAPPRRGSSLFASARAGSKRSWVNSTARSAFRYSASHPGRIRVPSGSDSAARPPSRDRLAFERRPLRPGSKIDRGAEETSRRCGSRPSWRDSRSPGVRLRGHAAAGGQSCEPFERRPSTRARCSMRRFSERAIDRPQCPRRGVSQEGLGSQPTSRSVATTPTLPSPVDEVSRARRPHAAPRPSKAPAFVPISTIPGCERRLQRSMRVPSVRRAAESRSADRGERVLALHLNRPIHRELVRWGTCRNEAFCANRIPTRGRLPTNGARRLHILLP